MRDPYFLNQQHKKNKKPEDGIEKLLDKLKELKSKDVYEIGMQFGQNLVYLKDANIDICGGVEFNPIFHSYGKTHYNIHQKDFKLHYTYINYWQPEYHKTYITNNFISLFENQENILKKLRENCDTLITNENGEIKVYVNNNSKRLNDSKSNSKSNQMQKDKPQENGLNKIRKFIKKIIGKYKLFNKFGCIFWEFKLESKIPSFNF